MSNPNSKASSTSRRDFLRIFGPTVGGLALLNARASSAETPSHVNPDAVPAILIDVSRCQGCGNCQRSCAEEHGLACDQRQDELSADTYTVLESCQISAAETRYAKFACMHCLNPGCVAACPVGALHRTEDGVVVVDTGKCIGCRYCQYACPFSIPKFEWDNPLGVMRKCTGCLERLAQGKEPACVAACPSGALKVGTRSELLASAHARIAAQPEKYVDYVYGEHEVGGTARLYISDVPFEQLGFPAVGDMPVPRYSEKVMSRTPVLAASIATVCTATYAFLRRRESGLRHETLDVEEEQS